jgi:hypothetical protein
LTVDKTQVFSTNLLPPRPQANTGLVPFYACPGGNIILPEFKSGWRWTYYETSRESKPGFYKADIISLERGGVIYVIVAKLAGQKAHAACQGPLEKKEK